MAVLADLRNPAVGDELPPLTVPVARGDLVRYAGAAGDFNPIHYDEAAATAIGLPGVVAHGMFTMALAIRVVTDLLDDPARLVSYGVRFTKPVVVPADAPAEVEIAAKVGSVDQAEDGRRTARIDITARSAETSVLGRARAVVAL